MALLATEEKIGWVNNFFLLARKNFQRKTNKKTQLVMIGFIFREVLSFDNKIVLQRL